MNNIATLQHDHIDSFVKNCCEDPVRYEARGILNIEGFYWWSLVGHYKPDIILESGVFLGRSTEILARAQRYFKISQHFAFDVKDEHEKHVRKKLARYETSYQIRSSTKGFRDILQSSQDKKIVAIIDGPKSGRPFTDLFEILSNFPNCCAIASHDCMPGSKIPPVFSDMCQKKFPQGKIIFTKPDDNRSIEFINGFLRKDLEAHYKDDPEKMAELLNRSHYVGLLLAKQS